MHDTVIWKTEGSITAASTAASNISVIWKYYASHMDLRGHGWQLAVIVAAAVVVCMEPRDH